jgi:hypothetical protein
MLLYTHIVYLFTYESKFIVFVYNILSFLNFLCVSYCLLAQVNNILLINGIKFSVFRGPDETSKFLNIRLQCGQ